MQVSFESLITVQTDHETDSTIIHRSCEIAMLYFLGPDKVRRKFYADEQRALEDICDIADWAHGKRK